MNFTKVIFALAIGSVATMQSAGAQAVGTNYFSFNGGSAAPDGSYTSPATGSWFSLLLGDTDSDGILDQFAYTPMRAAGTSGTDLSPGNLNFNDAETIAIGNCCTNHNTGNSIDQDWTFLGAYGAHFTNQALEVTWDGVSNTATVNMDGWMWAWTGQVLDWGTGADAIINLGGDGLGGGNDTLDYIAIGFYPFGGVQYTLHLEGNAVLTPVPETNTWAMMLAGLGLVGVAAAWRRKQSKA